MCFLKRKHFSLPAFSPVYTLSFSALRFPCSSGWIDQFRARLLALATVHAGRSEGVFQTVDGAARGIPGAAVPARAQAKVTMSMNGLNLGVRHASK